MDSAKDPEGGGAELRFQDIFDLRDIQAIQDDFARATGVASLITAPDGTPITEPSNFCELCYGLIRKTERGLAACVRSGAVIGAGAEAGPTYRPCLSAGLLDGGAPIKLGERRVANWLVGQVLDETSDLEAIRRYGAEIGADAEAFEAALSRVPRMSAERFAAVCGALYRIAGQLSALAYANVRQERIIAEKDALYRELKHRVKNSMALIAGLVGLEEAHARSDEVREALANMRTRLDSFATLYELLGGEKEPDAIAVDSYLARIVDSISESFVSGGRIVFDLDVERAPVHARTAAPVGLIVMELAANALKYAFPDGRRGRVSIRLRIDESRTLLLSVADDGVGLPEGFDPKRSEGLGMELIGMLVRQFKGNWRAVSVPAAAERGARFEIELPLDPPTSGSPPAGA